MDIQKLNLKEIFQFGWDKFKENAALLIGTTAIYYVLTLFLTFLFQKLIPIEHSTLWLTVTRTISALIGMYFLIGLFRIALAIANDQIVHWTEIFKNGEYLFNYFFAYILYFLVFAIGLVLLIFPGIIWGIQFSFYPCFIIDKKMNAIDALKASSALSKGYKWELFGFYILLIILNAIGTILLGIGLLVSIPISLLAYVYVYRKLS